MITVSPTVPVSETLSAYCFGRILAERFGLAFSYPAIRGLLKDSELEGKRVTGRSSSWWGNGPFSSQTGQRLERADFELKPYSGLRLDGGGFQRWELLAEAKQEILQDWIQTAHRVPDRDSDEFAICLSTPTERPAERAGEKPITVAGGCLGELEIRRLTRVAHGSRFVFVTEDAAHPLLDSLSDLGIPVLVASDWEQFLWIRAFSKVAISQNARHWWAALTGAAKEIYFPKCVKGPWTAPQRPVLSHEPWWQGIDLRVPDDARFIYDW